MTTRLNDVFTPNDQPTITYVRREQRGLEVRLKSALATPKIVASLSGPSKTGKTVLIKSVLSEDDLIYLRGAYIRSVDEFWQHILASFEAPSSEAVTESRTAGGTIGGSAGGEAGVPLVAKGKAQVDGSANYATTTSVEKVIPKNPHSQVVKEIGGSSFTILLDDYHYMPIEIQIEIAKIIKSLAESDVSICTALVPHRSEDVLKANPELRGRVVSIDIPDWEVGELRLIAERGFAALNVVIDHDVITHLASEAMGSPQLMQVLCLSLCHQLGILEFQGEAPARFDVDQKAMDLTLEVSANFASSAELVQALHSGPKVKGQPRTQYDLYDGTRGDVYRAILLAITSDPVARDFSYDEIYQRVKNVCVHDSPTGQSISQSLNHMCNIAKQNSQGHPIMEWDDANLHIADPYLAFYMRASRKIGQLGVKKNDGDD